ncbi:MAG: helix-turn-helix domain-containing protein [Clostridiaceae bacterium]|nr:TetR/AcrR family transcriptional regulator [Eubacteriales bacterium]
MGKINAERPSAQDVILKTAARLFTEKGVHGTSLNDIADAAGMSKGTLYYHYPAKEQLVNDIADAHIEGATDAMLLWMGGVKRETPLREAVLSLLNALVQENGEERKSLLHVVLCAEAATGNEPLFTKLSEAYRAWTVILELGLLRANVRDADAVLKRAQTFFTLLDGYRLQNGGRLTGAQLDAIAELLSEE